MSLDDVIYCRVLSVTSEEGPEGRPRQRIKLSTRGVDTITGEESAASVARTQQQELSQNLNSTIGMGIALDPMANSNLILKSEKSSDATALINGYALVGDTEGEPDLPLPPAPVAAKAPLQPMGRGRGTTMPAWMAKGDGPGAPSSNEVPVRPMGRGRGTTLPAWMTHGGDADQKEEEGSSRKHDKHRRKEKKRHSRKRHRDDDDDDRDGRHSKKHHRRREERKSRHDNGSHNSERDESSRDKRHRKKHRHPHGHSPSIGSEQDKRGRSREDNEDKARRDDRKSRRRSPSYSDDSNRRNRYDSKRHHRKSRKLSYSNSSLSERNVGRPRSGSQASSGGGSHYRRHHDKDSESNHAKTDTQFTSVAEAERLIAELENKQRRR